MGEDERGGDCVLATKIEHVGGRYKEDESELGEGDGGGRRTS